MANCRQTDDKVDRKPLRLEWRSPAELAENPLNWRTHPQAQVDALTGVIAEVGWAGACLYNERTGRLIDGHARRKVALAQGCDRVPVLVGDWDEAAEAKILATLDPLAAMAQADAGKLDALLREVQTGSQPLADLLTSLAKDSGIVPPEPAAGGGGDDFDTQAAEEGPCRPQPGDLWLIDGGKHRVVCGDSTDADTVAQLMAGERAGVVATDPPYAVEYVDKARDMAARGYGHSRAKSRAAIQGDGLNEDSARELWRAVFTAARTVAAAENAAWYVWHAPGRAMMVLYSLLAEMGFLHHQTIIWVKNNFVIGRCDYQWIHEPCFYGWMKGKRPDFLGEKNQTTVWQLPRDTHEPQHPTQKPVAVFDPPMRNHLRPGGVVYDPFLGSGTTLVAAHRAGRRCFGLELEPRYCEVILRRAEAEGLSVEKG